jgi:hypothetical protein
MRFRIARVCASLNDLPPRARHAPHPAFRLIARRVAALALIVLTAVLVTRLATRQPLQPPCRCSPRPRCSTGWARPACAAAHDRASGRESENLLTDLVTLTTVINERTLAILF